jgi:hypothetical protein
MRAALQVGGAGLLIFRLLRTSEWDEGVIRAKNGEGNISPEASILKSNRNDQRVHATADLATVVKYARNSHKKGTKVRVAILSLAGLEMGKKVLWNFDSGEGFRKPNISDGEAVRESSTAGKMAKKDGELLLKSPIDIRATNAEVIGVREGVLFGDKKLSALG